MGDGVTALGHLSEPFIPACFPFQVLPAGLVLPILTVRCQTKPLPTVPWPREAYCAYSSQTI